MNRESIVLTLMLISLTSQAKTLPHMDPEMTAPEYQILLDKLQKQQGYLSKQQGDPLVSILAIGKRNLDWIEAINATRDKNNKIELTTPETTVAYPIDHPNISNRDIIQDHLLDLINTMPEEMVAVLFSKGPLPNVPGVDDETFIKNARAMNRIYEAASRWLLQEPELDEYMKLARSDIRGYYFLQQEKELETKLSDWAKLDGETKGKYTPWLMGICENNPSELDCGDHFSAAVKKNEMLEFYKKYQVNAQKMYDSFFEIQNPRAEVLWDHRNQGVMYAPFTLPERQDVADWLQVNVQDEFKLSDWKLQMTYSQLPNLPKVVFEAGATPHVNELGGDTITMDANRVLNEYAITWTIRHEYGHVLGLPDCYVEFYSKELGAMINYQIDTTNLMCSRRGHFQAQHYAQLRKHYFKG